MKQVTINRINVNQMTGTELVQTFETLAFQHFKNPRRFAQLFPAEARRWITSSIPQLYMARGPISQLQRAKVGIYQESIGDDSDDDTDDDGDVRMEN